MLICRSRNIFISKFRALGNFRYHTDNVITVGTPVETGDSQYQVNVG